MNTAEHPDWKLVTKLGGAARVADLLGYKAAGGVQRVQNWKTRGIPPAVKVEHPELFIPGFKKCNGKHKAKPEPETT